MEICVMYDGATSEFLFALPYLSLKILLNIKVSFFRYGSGSSWKHLALRWTQLSIYLEEISRVFFAFC